MPWPASGRGYAPPVSWPGQAARPDVTISPISRGFRTPFTQLGLRIPSIERDGRTSGYFRRHRDEAEVEGIEAMSVDVAVQAIEDAVFLAYDLSSDRDDLVDEGVPYPDEMSFTSLRKFPWKKM